MYSVAIFLKGNSTPVRLMYKGKDKMREDLAQMDVGEPVTDDFGHTFSSADESVTDAILVTDVAADMEMQIKLNVMQAEAQTAFQRKMSAQPRIQPIGPILDLGH